MLVKLAARPKKASFQVIVFAFAGFILCGALLLTLPAATASGESAPFIDALFTATTSVCVTGLVVQDTALYWSLFGQIVILVLIQTGGIGVITVATLFAISSGKKIGLLQRIVMQQAVDAPQISGILRLIAFIVKMVLMMELLGMAIMAPVFCRDFGLGTGLWMSLFHAVSAFCNAGIDLMGVRQPFSSLTGYAAQPAVNFAVSFLLIAGGIGFLTWDDIRANRLRFHKYRLQSKVVLFVSAWLIVLPGLFFFFHEFDHMPLVNRFWVSWFQAVTPRTAGFNTVDLTQMSGCAQLVLISLMLIGGSPGSTAGGMKTTTVAVLIACAVSAFRRRGGAELFGRRIAPETVLNAVAVLCLYLTLCFVGAMLISIMEDLPIQSCLFETASAVGTVGLSLGITPQLSVFSKLILIVLMFFGRVGGLTLIYATLSGRNQSCGKLPQERITVG